MSTIIYYIKYWGHCIMGFIAAFFTFFPGVIFFKRPFVQKYMGLWYTYIACLFLRLKVRVHNKDKIPNESAIFVLNHQSTLDVISVFRIGLDNAKIIGKKELVYIPILGWTFYVTGNILINRAKGKKAASTLSSGVEAIKKRGVSVMVFPEGTRNMNGEFLPFKKGAFHMAVEAQVPIVPIVVSTYTRFLDRKNKRFKKGTIDITILDSISTKGLKKTDIKQLSEDVYHNMLDIFDKG